MDVMLIILIVCIIFGFCIGLIIERQNKKEENKAQKTFERVVHDKTSSNLYNEAIVKENTLQSTVIDQSLVSIPRFIKSSSHHDTSRDWPKIEQTESERKGFVFEQYVDNHFPDKYFKRLEWRSDIKDTNGRLSESSKYPDLEYEIRKSGVRFAVECKWRQSFLKKNGDLVIWWAQNEKQIDNYIQYGKSQNIDVIVLIGIGGTPDNPDKVYSIPLAAIKSPYLPKSVLWNYFVGKQSIYFYNETNHNIRLFNQKSYSRGVSA